MPETFNRPEPRRLATFEPNMEPTTLEHESDGRNADYPVYRKVAEETEWKSLIRVNLPAVSALQEVHAEEPILINNEGEIAGVNEECKINPEVTFTSDGIGNLQLAS